MKLDRDPDIVLSWRFASVLDGELNPDADPKKLALMRKLVEAGYEQPPDPHDLERDLRMLLGGQALKQAGEL